MSIALYTAPLLSINSSSPFSHFIYLLLSVEIFETKALMSIRHLQALVVHVALPFLRNLLLYGTVHFSFKFPSIIFLFIFLAGLHLF